MCSLNSVTLRIPEKGIQMSMINNLKCLQPFCSINSYINNHDCYIASAETKRDWLIHGHVALDKCNVSLGQQVNNCCPLRPAPYINKQNGGETRKFNKLGFSSILFEEIHIGREDMLLKLKFNYSSKFWLF